MWTTCSVCLMNPLPEDVGKSRQANAFRKVTSSVTRKHRKSLFHDLPRISESEQVCRGDLSINHSSGLYYGQGSDMFTSLNRTSTRLHYTNLREDTSDCDQGIHYWSDSDQDGRSQQVTHKNGSQIASMFTKMVGIITATQELTKWIQP